MPSIRDIFTKPFRQSSSVTATYSARPGVTQKQRAKIKLDLMSLLIYYLYLSNENALDLHLGSLDPVQNNRQISKEKKTNSNQQNRQNRTAEIDFVGAI